MEPSPSSEFNAAWEFEESPLLLFGSSLPRGVIPPYSSVEAPILLLAKAVGRQQHTARIAVFGRTQPPLEVVLSCFGQGPTVHVQPPELAFGKIPVLTDVTRVLNLFNQSPIPAPFTARMVRSKSPWDVEPSDGEVPPEGQLELRLVAHLKDTLLFKDKLELAIKDSHTHTIPVSATGTGTTIVSNQPFNPSLDLGTHFSQSSLRSIKMSKAKDVSNQVSLPSIITSRKGKVSSRGSQVPFSREEPTFSLSPSRVELFPGCSVDMVLTGSSDSAKVVHERLVCLAILGLQGRYERIMTVDVTCRFVAPVLSISTKQLNFYAEKVPGKSLVPLYEKVVLKNISSLALSMDLSLTEPFALCEAKGDPSMATTKAVVLGDGMQAEVWVSFNPTYHQDQMSRMADEFLEVHYKEHPQQDTIGLHGEVHFPNLHFSATCLDFGCVLNHTETQRELTIINCSPLPVSYCWTFLVDQRQLSIRETEVSSASLEERDPEGETKERNGFPEQLPLSTPFTTSLLPKAHSSLCCPVGVEEVFDILPIYGQLQPGDSQLVTFTFYGHADYSGQVVAQCQVEKGPTYDVTLKGEASDVTYSLDSTHINLGLQLFDHVAEVELTLKNCGRMGFRFTILLPQDEKVERQEDAPEDEWQFDGEQQQEEEHEVKVEMQGAIPLEPKPSQPMVVPAELQVAYLPPQDIILTGEGVFPRISLDLPRHLPEELYGEVVQQSRAAVEADRPTPGGGETLEDNCMPTYEELLHTEVERRLVKDNAVAVTSSLLELRDASGSSSKWQKLSRFLLPEYVLDFGYVIHGKAVSHTVKVTNTGPVDVSFRAIFKPLAGTGFSTEFERVKSLPCCETHTFTVKFDPQGANLPMGDISVVMPIQVTGGPMVQVRLCAVVTTPALTVSTDMLQFDTVQCGMCQINKFLPLYQRKKALLEQRPPKAVFQMEPSSGLLHPRNRVNVQVKFSPAEGRAYSKRLVVHVAQSTQTVVILAQGQGEEPELEFSPSVLELGPCLPLSAGEEAVVTVTNPCPFPIEFYSLEFDTQYLEEEKILCLIKDYDEHNVLLLPPRAPGDTLPPELLDHYKEHFSQLADDELEVDLHKKEAFSEKQDRQEEDERPKQKSGHTQNREKMSPAPCELNVEETDGMGLLETTPVSRAIARYLGFELSPEDLAARNQRGIAVIVYGAPLTGKSSIAVALAHHYGGVCLSIDAVVTEALTSGASPASLTARQRYDRAATEHAQRKAEEAVQIIIYVLAARAMQDSTGAASLFPLRPAVSPAPASDANAHLNVEAVAKQTEERNQISDWGDLQRTGGSEASISLDDQISVILSRVGGEATLCHVLPEQLLIDTLAERLQLSDCYRGVVIDGLESVYAQSTASALQVVLKAFSNRKHIYLVNLKDSYTAWKAREQAQREADEALQREAADRERQRLQEMDEEEYDALPEEEKERIAQWHLEQVRERKRRELEQVLKEQEEKRQRKEMERLKEEELKKKNKKAGKNDIKDEQSERRSQLGRMQSTASVDGRRMSYGNISKDSPTEVKEQANGVQPSKEGEDEQRKKQETKEPKEESPQHLDKLERETTQPVKDDCPLLSRFCAYEQSQVKVAYMLQHWDRIRGLLLEKQPSASKRTRKEGEKERLEKEKQKADVASIKVASPVPSQMLPPGEGGAPEDKESLPAIIPHILLSVTERNYPSVVELLKGGILPPPEEVKNELGLGPRGPPVPPPAIFSVIPFPKKREDSNSHQNLNCFTLLAPSEERTDTEADMHALEPPMKEEVVVSPSRIRGKRAGTASKNKDKDGKAGTLTKNKKDKESQRDKMQTPSKRGGKSLEPPPSSPRLSVTPLSDCSEQGIPSLDLLLEHRKNTFRWVVPANGKVTLKIGFQSSSCGVFDQTLNFELLGTGRCYQVLCRGICTYPSICTDYTTLFALTKSVPKMKEGLQKTYVVQPGVFEFGPLLCGKTRDRYKERKYPENTERFLIHNNSALDAEVQFCFQNDTKATTYLLDPPTMTLKPDQKQELTVWAYPTSLGHFEDCVVCCIKDNPEPVIIRLSCLGVRPELELDHKQLHFNKIIVHREARHCVTLRNKTALPAVWRLRGLEELGAEFSTPEEHGIISPHSSCCLHFCFRAVKPLNIKKTLRLEVSDVDNIVGIVHTENMQVTCEAYDIALDITFPKGSSGAADCLDFGTIKVFQEVKLCIVLKNNGKYEIAYKFTVEQTDPSQPDLSSIFLVSPQQGTLPPTDRLSMVQILFRENKELSLKEQPILRCQFLFLAQKLSLENDPHHYPYNITPRSNIDFGSLVYGCKKTQSFTIENNGEFEIQFNISRMIKDPVPIPPGKPGKKIAHDGPSAKLPTLPGKARRFDPIQKDVSPTQRMVYFVGLTVPWEAAVQEAFERKKLRYTELAMEAEQRGWRAKIYPVVTVYCEAEQLGSWNECLAVDITDRDPSDQPGGIPYRLIAEVCVPELGLDFASIFEEHYLCRSSSLLCSEQFRDAEGIYVLDEHKFVFNNVLVGRTAYAHLKLTNKSKVPCQLNLGIKSVSTKLWRSVEVFDLSPAKLCIPGQSYSFAVVTFTPQSMQLYHAVFEATLEGASSVLSMVKNRMLRFDLTGEGNLPSVCVERPSLRNNQGNPILQFKRLLVGHRHTLPLVLRNDGNMLALVQIDMVDKQGVFTLKAAPGNSCCSIHSTQLDGASESEHQLAYRASFCLSVGQQAEFEVNFCSYQPVNAKAKMTVQVMDNQYNTTIIRLVGEAYQDIISFDNISGPSRELEQEMCEDGNYELLNFGDCHVGQLHQEYVTMTNHSSGTVLRFEWPAAEPYISFSPQVGHLHASCSKEVTITFYSNQPVTLTNQPLKCKLCEVAFQQPLEQVPDWDDRQRTVRWSTSSKEAARRPRQQPVKEKVIKMDPEPSCSVLEDSKREKELHVSAVCDYAKFSCNADSIRFKDTMLYQTRLFQLQMENNGIVKLEYSWQVFMNPNSNSITHDDQEDVNLDSRPGSRSGRAVTALRPSSALASVTSLMLGDPELPPFSVEPIVGAVDPGAVQIFKIRFSPLKVSKFQGRLVCSVPNLQDSDKAPCLSVCGRSLLPYCYFQLEDSDYVSEKHCKPDLMAPLDSSTRVIEFNSVGFSAPTTRRFNVLNPTNKPYSFQWRCEDPGPCPFRCLTPCGTILPGKKVEACLEYVAEQLDVVESLWSFLIEELSLSVLFLLVGTSREPVVYLDRAHLDLGNLLVGETEEQVVYLVNGEEQPYHFSVLQPSLQSEVQHDSLTLMPMSGTVAPKHNQEGCMRFRLLLQVKGKAERLALNVKADGYTMSTCVQVKNADGGLREVSPGHPDTLDYGKVELSEKSTFMLLMSNMGRFSLNVNFDLVGPRELVRFLEAKPQGAIVEVGEQLCWYLSFCPQKTCDLQDVRLNIKVKHGPTFTFAVKGRAVAAGLDFSFTKHNFGKCFLYCNGMVAVSQTLVISNKEERDISVQCQFENTSYLEIGLQPDIVPAGGAMEVPVTFYPREACHYHEKVTFIINGCAKKVVEVLGQGIEMKVLTFTPAGELTLKAHKGRCVAEIQFSPRQRMSAFTAELQAECMGTLFSLLTICGCCQGIQQCLAILEPRIFKLDALSQQFDPTDVE
ncbi:hydrocephalus-inducing protein homolog [Lampris incognitus]|uniref:hydrocephalus-inducing protein homolog n=1 Tax=Lampris incognitus TaxID=2546036 RepID=UPI0024B5D4F5|nr:hydrocephalus-inducing protein homolog [Lampris incognitus]